MSFLKRLFLKAFPIQIVEDEYNGLKISQLLSSLKKVERDYGQVKVVMIDKQPKVLGFVASEICRIEIMKNGNKFEVGLLTLGAAQKRRFDSTKHAEREI